MGEGVCGYKGYAKAAMVIPQSPGLCLQELYAKWIWGGGHGKKKRLPTLLSGRRDLIQCLVPGQVSRLSKLTVWGGKSQPPVAPGA